MTDTQLSNQFEPCRSPNLGVLVFFIFQTTLEPNSSHATHHTLGVLAIYYSVQLHSSHVSYQNLGIWPSAFSNNFNCAGYHILGF